MIVFLYIFVLFQVGLYFLFSCPECETTEGVQGFCLDQPRDEIEHIKCRHSKAAEYLMEAQKITGTFHKSATMYANTL